jgi:hypothetical protein
VRRCQLAAETIFTSVYSEFKLEKLWLASPVDRFELIAHSVGVSLTDTYKAVERVVRATEEALGESSKTFQRHHRGQTFWRVSNYDSAQTTKEIPPELPRRVQTSEGRRMHFLGTWVNTAPAGVTRADLAG